MRALIGTIGLLGMIIAPMFVLVSTISFLGGWAFLLALLVYAFFMLLYLTVY